MSAFGKGLLAIIGGGVIIYGWFIGVDATTVMHQIHAQLVIITGVLLWCVTR